MKRLFAAILALLPVLVLSCASVAPSPTPRPLPPLTPTLAPTAGQTRAPAGAVDLAPFKAMAKSSTCADIHNRLFVIDDRLVFWDIAGNCSDASYSQMLFGGIPDQILCVSHDSIAGPVKNCRDEQYQSMFATITANLGKPDLGLGPQHRVQPVPF